MSDGLAALSVICDDVFSSFLKYGQSFQSKKRLEVAAQIACFTLDTAATRALTLFCNPTPQDNGHQAPVIAAGEIRLSRRGGATLREWARSARMHRRSRHALPDDARVEHL